MLQLGSYCSDAISFLNVGNFAAGFFAKPLYHRKMIKGTSLSRIKAPEICSLLATLLHVVDRITSRCLASHMLSSYAMMYMPQAAATLEHALQLDVEELQETLSKLHSQVRVACN
jgi:hypothetical protein